MKINQKIISILTLGFVLLLASFFANFKNEEELLVYYFDVGQGDSAFIDLPNGNQVLIDAGKGEKVLKELEKVLPIWDKHINILILSHGDLDHIGGFFDVLESYEVDYIIRAQTFIDSKYEIELLEKAKKLGIEIKELGLGDKIILDQYRNIYFEIYSPTKENLLDENDTSLVIELVYGENEFLFTGDATIETELKLIQNFPEKINSDVLKVGHHGSKTSTSQLFLEKVSPDFSILSYGENSYGHPNSEVLSKLENSGGQIFKTKERATIVARLDGINLEVNYLDDLFDQTSFFQSLVSSIFINSFYSS